MCHVKHNTIIKLEDRCLQTLAFDFTFNNGYKLVCVCKTTEQREEITEANNTS